MKFISITGRQLMKIVSSDEIAPADLQAAGVTDDSIIRINQQGDIEIRRSDNWDILGGLIGDFEVRLKEVCGLDWA